MKNKAGFSLIELMVVIAVLGVLSAIAIPVMSNWQGRHRFGGTVRDVLLTLRQARLAAVEQNETVVVTVDVGAGSWEAFVDDGAGSVDGDLNGVLDDARNGVKDGGERVINAGSVPEGIRITAANFSGNPSFRFDNRGFPTDAVGLLTDGVITLASDLGGSKQIDLLRSGHSVIQ